MADPIRIAIEVWSIGKQLPVTGVPVLVFHREGVDRGALYGRVWRHAEYGEEQLYGVTHWAELPEISHDKIRA